MIVALILTMGFSMELIAHELPDFDKLWDYNKPAETEAKFRQLLPQAQAEGSRDYVLQLLTQIARTQSLQRKFKEAHDILDGVEPQLGPLTPVAEVRYLLERGRTYNSAKEIPSALPLFNKAYELSVACKLDFYAVDAAHMVAIAEPESDKQMHWNLKALNIAEQSNDPKAQKWKGSLYNNIGWMYYDSSRFAEAFEMFQKALAFREKVGDPSSLRFAKWCVAKSMRSLKRYDEALKMQKDLETEFAGAGEVDGYVFEELGELYLVLENKSEAKKYFGLAYAELSKDEWFKANEPKRLERIKLLAGA